MAKDRFQQAHFQHQRRRYGAVESKTLADTEKLDRAEFWLKHHDPAYVAEEKQRERKLGNASTTVRPNPNVPYGWPSDGSIPPWATEDEIAAAKRRR
jgi:hypothetical protein